MSQALRNHSGRGSGKPWVRGVRRLSEVLSCHVDERAAIKIRAVVFRPDGQKLTGAELKQQCARGAWSSVLRGASRGA